ncbi:MAG: SUMF1/EgtB/PvdO family nonheme iron enzyme [Candidatus Accumulibacter sp.]|uniref:SUMF1/EgtB/PvdO family nonheme iron enzyme n=1 Tax=Candidatus Accumulibacter affinis TaxID=2954384 RepID=A0A935TB71_9PROT|nr:SUMF1/EgtB/PvdO family nonheme iron enzyme [Candidatus Accumulibacter affinis]
MLWQGHDDRLADLGEHWSHGALLPIRVVLRRFAEQLPPGEKAVHAGDLWAFIGRELEASGYGLSERTLEYLHNVARRHGALIVLYGLDECGSGEARQRVLKGVDEIMHSAGPKCRFLLTARPYAWPGGPDPAHGVYALADLSDPQIEQFIGAWYAALVRRKWLLPGEAERKRADLLAARQRPDLLPLARNALLLTLMATLHANRGRLPDDRADLYNDSVELLMLRWNRQIGADRALLDELAIPTLKPSDLREVLEELAFNVHQQSVVSEPLVHAGHRDPGTAATAGTAGTADIGEDRLIRAFRPLLKHSRDKAAVVVDYIEKRAGLLIGQGERDGERQFAFPHRTFQEFLAACHLAAKDDFPAECARLARAAPGHWQVVLPLAARLAKAERGASAADELIGGTNVADFCRKKRPDVSDWTCALLAGLQLLEIGVGAIRQRDRSSAIATRVADWLTAALPVPANAGGLPARQRAYAGDVLAQLGDPRAYLLQVDQMRFVAVPRGAFWMGEEGDRNAPLHRNETLNYTYWIAETPVTVAQFAEFVAASADQGHDPDALNSPSNRPLVLVSWHDARAFCAWLSERWRSVLPAGWSVSLPSEAEWEKAARGGEQIPASVRYATIAQGFPVTTAALHDNPSPRRRYPWGDEWDADQANAEDGIGETRTPGCYAAGRSPHGCEDMAGNVWEWTRSLWGTGWGYPDFVYPYDAADRKREDLDAPDDIWRVVRGGSWSDHRDFRRCAFRFRNHPGFRYDELGFRVVLRSSPVP